MISLPEPLEFQWDFGNAEKNLRGHGVSDKESEEVFINTPFLISEDLKHSTLERRFQALGKSSEGRLLFMAFTIREERVRIISARSMNKKEILIYEKA